MRKGKLKEGKKSSNIIFKGKRERNVKLYHFAGKYSCKRRRIYAFAQFSQ